MDRSMVLVLLGTAGLLVVSAVWGVVVVQKLLHRAAVQRVEDLKMVARLLEGASRAASEAASDAVAKSAEATSTAIGEAVATALAPPEGPAVTEGEVESLARRFIEDRFEVDWSDPTDTTIPPFREDAVMGSFADLPEFLTAPDNVGGVGGGAGGSL